MVSDGEPFQIAMGTVNGYRALIVQAGIPTTVHVTPPAGEDYAFDYQQWPRRVDISISPTGRSVRIWVDGVEIKKGSNGNG